MPGIDGPSPLIHDLPMKLLIAPPHPIALLQALAVARATGPEAVVLADAVGLAFLGNAASPVRGYEWEWSSQKGATEFRLALTWRNRRRLAVLKRQPIAGVAISGERQLAALGADLNEPRAVATALARLIGVPPTAYPPEAAQAGPDLPAGSLSAGADALARVAQHFRHVPPDAVGKFRLMWVSSDPRQHADTLLGLVRYKAHVHVVQAVEVGTPPLMLARQRQSPQMQQWQARLQSAGVMNLGAVNAYVGIDRLVGFLAHADIVVTPLSWVQQLATGLGKAVFVLETDGLSLDDNSEGSRLPAEPDLSADPLLERVLRAMPYLR